MLLQHVATGAVAVAATAEFASNRREASAANVSARGVSGTKSICAASARLSNSRAVHATETGIATASQTI